MTKREKREKRKRERLNKILDISLGAVTKKCECGQTCRIPPIDGWATCPKCGNIVRRYK